jgi:hypothetical protein
MEHQKDMMAAKTAHEQSMFLVEQAQKIGLHNDKLQTMKDQFATKLESEEARFLVEKVMDQDAEEQRRNEKQASLMLGMAKEERAATEFGLEAMHKYGIRYSPEKRTYEPIPEEELPPGVPAGGLEAFEARTRRMRAERGEAVTPYQRERLELERARSRAKSLEQMGDNIDKLHSMRDRTARSLDVLMSQAADPMKRVDDEYVQYTASRRLELEGEIKEYESQIRSQADVRAAIESGFNAVPGWVRAAPTSSVQLGIDQLRSMIKAAEAGDTIAKRSLEGIKERAGNVEDLMQFLEAVVSNRKTYAERM